MSKKMPKSGELLISEPSILNDNQFSRSVILLAEYNTTSGAVGFILNRKSEYVIRDLVPNIDSDHPVYLGGPVSTDNLYFMHRVPELIPDSIKITEDVFWGGSFEKISTLLRDNLLSSSDIRFFLGYSGWSRSQLLRELKEKSWFVKTNKFSNILDVDVTSLWKNEILKLGDSYKIWANAPKNPRLN